MKFSVAPPVENCDDKLTYIPPPKLLGHLFNGSWMQGDWRSVIRIYTRRMQKLSLRPVASASARCRSGHRMSGVGIPRKIDIVVVD